jgi:hypothetical protein
MSNGPPLYDRRWADGFEALGEDTPPDDWDAQNEVAVDLAIERANLEGRGNWRVRRLPCRHDPRANRLWPFKVR